MNKQADILKRFIVFEGIDGTGTTTQLNRLHAWLGECGLPHSITCEPTKMPTGALIRQALSGSLPLHPETVAYLFAADRCEHLYGEDGIVARTARNEFVISDRYFFSSLAYQGITCGSELPRALNGSFPLPELLLYFALPPATAMDRMARRESLEIYENLSFQEKTAAEFDAVIKSYEGSGMKIVIVDAGRNPDEVELFIRREISAMLGTNGAL